ncbi:hypothetical protein O9992_30340 [Vibrio lentus]|nr:hypothetical protein [Vibrio lentus]
MLDSSIHIRPYLLEAVAYIGGELVAIPVAVWLLLFALFGCRREGQSAGEQASVMNSKKNFLILMSKRSRYVTSGDRITACSRTVAQ